MGRRLEPICLGGGDLAGQGESSIISSVCLTAHAVPLCVFVFACRQTGVHLGGRLQDNGTSRRSNKDRTFYYKVGDMVKVKTRRRMYFDVKSICINEAAVLNAAHEALLASSRTRR